MKRWLIAVVPFLPLLALVWGALWGVYVVHRSNEHWAHQQALSATHDAVLNADSAVRTAQRIREQRKGDYTDLSDPWFRIHAYGLDQDIVPFSGSGFPDVGSFKKFGMHASHVPSAVCVPYVLAASAGFEDVYVGGTGGLDRGKSVFYQGEFLDYTLLDAACHASDFVDIDLITH